MNSAKQEQDGTLFTSRHCEFGPQGDGSQTLIGCTGCFAKIKEKIVIKENQLRNR